jgi:hypothetical protein
MGAPKGAHCIERGATCAVDPLGLDWRTLLAVLFLPICELGAGLGIYLYDSVGSSEALIAVSAIGQLSFHFSAIPLELVLDIRPPFFLGDFVCGVSWTRGGGAMRYLF